MKQRIKTNTIVISGFPGVGKSHYKLNNRKRVVDSDSSRFDKDNFPANYIADIKERLGGYDKVLVSSHRVVRDALVEQKIPFVLVYPTADQKSDYIQRYKDRGSPQDLIDIIDEFFEIWISDCSIQKGCTHVVLKKGQYLSDVIE